MIEVNQLVKQYGSYVAVDHISFTAEFGQVTGFLGPNGAGKTTTMRILTGYLPPTAGKAIVAGHDVFEDSMGVRQKVGYLPENVPLYRDMTARGYLMYLAEIRGLNNRKKRAEEALEQVRLAHRANSRIATLSKGMRQRVGLAAALLHDPEVLILDEPTIGLDPFQVLELRELVRELGRSHTVLFSTHILSEAEQVCDKVVIINQGRIIAQGAPGSLRGQLERGGRILARIEGPTDAIRNALQQVADVAQVDVEHSEFVITPQGASDPRPQIAQTVIQNGWRLVELRSLAVSLEEIFLEVTRQSLHRQAETTDETVDQPAETMTEA